MATPANTVDTGWSISRLLRAVARHAGNRIQTVACAHDWTRWERETYALQGPYGITNGHLRQVRSCTKCGWSEVSKLTD